MILIPDHQLQIRNTKIYSPKIKNPFKLVALGDTHVSEMMEKTKLYPVQLQIEKENPDYIALVGDIVDAPSQLQHTYVQKKIIEFVKAAAEVAPVFIVLGSHDYVDHKIKKISIFINVIFGKISLEQLIMFIYSITILIKINRHFSWDTGKH